MSKLPGMGDGVGAEKEEDFNFFIVLFFSFKINTFTLL